LSGRDNSQPEELLIEEGNHKVDGGLQAMLRLLERRPQPTAVLASNDLTAIGALRGIRQYGLRVPEDISVVGFDDIQMAEYTEPPLTTVRLQQSEVASLACNALLQFDSNAGDGLGTGREHLAGDSRLDRARAPKRLKKNSVKNRLRPAVESAAPGLWFRVPQAQGNG